MSNSIKLQINCILLKSSDITSDHCINNNDRYLTYLNENKQQATVVLNSIARFNPLKFEYINSGLLRVELGEFFLNRGSKLPYKCLILTSRQAIESIEMALYGEIDQTSDQADQIGDDIQRSLDDNHRGKMIVYCVGESTLNRFVRFVNRRLADEHRYRFILRTGEQQNGEHLAKLIVSDYNNMGIFDVEKDVGKYAFYPCSSIRKDDLVVALKENGVDCTEVNAYCTSTNEASMRELVQCLNAIEHTSAFWVLVFFSPSGVDAVLSSAECSAMLVADKARFRLISIGPSTTHKLESTLFGPIYRVYELEKPSPQNLLKKLTEIFS